MEQYVAVQSPDDPNLYIVMDNSGPTPVVITTVDPLSPEFATLSTPIRLAVNTALVSAQAVASGSRMGTVAPRGSFDYASQKRGATGGNAFDAMFNAMGSPSGFGGGGMANWNADFNAWSPSGFGAGWNPNPPPSYLHQGQLQYGLNPNLTIQQMIAAIQDAQYNEAMAAQQPQAAPATPQPPAFGTVDQDKMARLAARAKLL